MAGPHFRVRLFRSPAGIAATAAVATALVAGGVVGAGRLVASSSTDQAAPAPVVATSAPATPAGPVTEEPTSAPTASASAAPSPATARPSKPASRSKARTSAAATPTATKKAAPQRATPTVVGSGTCGASFYADGQLTANGESFDPEAMTAAHRTLPFGTRVRVTNPATGSSVTVRINDRGPFVDGRCLDLSRAAFRAIAALDLGEISVRYEVLG